MSHYARALRLSHASSYPVPSKRMAAVVVGGGRVLSAATNIARAVGRPFSPGKHAEIRALRPHCDYSGCTLYVARRNGLSSRPCAVCWEAARQAGVYRVVYADSKGDIIAEAVM